MARQNSAFSLAIGADDVLRGGLAKRIKLAGQRQQQIVALAQDRAAGNPPASPGPVRKRRAGAAARLRKFRCRSRPASAALDHAQSLMRRCAERCGGTRYASMPVRASCEAATSPTRTGCIAASRTCPGIQMRQRLLYLVENGDRHGGEGLRNMTRSSCLHSSPTPMRSTSMSGRKKRRTISLEG